MKKHVYLGLSILKISKTVMYEFWFWDMIQWNQNKKKNKSWYKDTDSFTACIKTEDIYVDIAKDVERRFHTSNYELGRPFSRGKNKKDELGGKTMTDFAALRAKTYSYLTDNNDEDKKQKTQKSVS